MSESSADSATLDRQSRSARRLHCVVMCPCPAGVISKVGLICVSVRSRVIRERYGFSEVCCAVSRAPLIRRAGIDLGGALSILRNEWRTCKSSLNMSNIMASFTHYCVDGGF